MGSKREAFKALKREEALRRIIRGLPYNTPVARTISTRNGMGTVLELGKVASKVVKNSLFGSEAVEFKLYLSKIQKGGLTNNVDRWIVRDEDYAKEVALLLHEGMTILVKGRRNTILAKNERGMFVAYEFNIAESIDILSLDESLVDKTIKEITLYDETLY